MNKPWSLMGIVLGKNVWSRYIYCKRFLSSFEFVIRLSDWKPILEALSINKSLEHIVITSYYQENLPNKGNVWILWLALRLKLFVLYSLESHSRRKMPAIRSKDITTKLCTALKTCLSGSTSIKNLELQGLLLRKDDFTLLGKVVHSFSFMFFFVSHKSDNGIV